MRRSGRKRSSANVYAIAADGSYTQHVRLLFLPSVLAVGRNGTYVVAGRRGPIAATGPGRVSAAVGVAHTRRIDVHRLGGARYRQAAADAVSVDARGRVAVLYHGTVGRQSELRLAAGTATRLGTVATLARTAHLVAATLAGDDRGDVLVAWQQGDVVVARIRTAGGRLGPPQRLGRAAGFTIISAAIDDRRRAVVAWRSTRTSGTTTTAVSTVVAVAARPGGRFGSRAELERSTVTVPPGAGVRAALSGGRGIVAWTGGAGTAAVRVDVLGGAPATIAPPGFLSSLVVAPSGAVAIGWMAASEGQHPFVSLAQAPGAPFAAPEPIGNGSLTELRDVVLDPATSALYAVGPAPPVACWTAVRAAG